MSKPIMFNRQSSLDETHYNVRKKKKSLIVIDSFILKKKSFRRRLHAFRKFHTLN